MRRNVLLVACGWARGVRGVLRASRLIPDPSLHLGLPPPILVVTATVAARSAAVAVQLVRSSRGVLGGGRQVGCGRGGCPLAVRCGLGQPQHKLGGPRVSVQLVGVLQLCEVSGWGRIRKVRRLEARCERMSEWQSVGAFATLCGGTGLGRKKRTPRRFGHRLLE